MPTAIAFLIATAALLYLSARRTRRECAESQRRMDRAFDEALAGIRERRHRLEQRLERTQ
jgi:hypothetical protein